MVENKLYFIKDEYFDKYECEDNKGCCIKTSVS